MMVYTYYLPHFVAHPEHRFWQTNIVEARCDLNLSLRLLTEGYLTGYMNTLTLGDNVANPGGCAVYRDLDFEQRSVHELARLYPGLVTIYRRTGWGVDREQWRDAPKIRWKDAFDTAKFVQHFDEWPIDFANRIVGEYEKKYAAYIEEYRATH